MSSKEVWKDVPGYAGLYKISNKGRVFSYLTGVIKKSSKVGRGYLSVQLSSSDNVKSRHYVHRLVATAFIPNDDKTKTQVNHIDLDKTNNCVENLEWVTPLENMRHAWVNGIVDFRRSVKSDNKSGVKGVSFNEKTKKWTVKINGKYICEKKNFEDAVALRKEKEAELCTK